MSIYVGSYDLPLSYSFDDRILETPYGQQACAATSVADVLGYIMRAVNEVDDFGSALHEIRVAFTMTSSKFPNINAASVPTREALFGSSNKGATMVDLTMSIDDTSNTNVPYRMTGTMQGNIDPSTVTVGDLWETYVVLGSASTAKPILTVTPRLYSPTECPECPDVSLPTAPLIPMARYYVTSRSQIPNGIAGVPAYGTVTWGTGTNDYNVAISAPCMTLQYFLRQVKAYVNSLMWADGGTSAASWCGAQIIITGSRSDFNFSDSSYGGGVHYYDDQAGNYYGIPCSYAQMFSNTTRKIYDGAPDGGSSKCYIVLTPLGVSPVRVLTSTTIVGIEPYLVHIFRDDFTACYVGRNSTLTCMNATTCGADMNCKIYLFAFNSDAYSTKLTSDIVQQRGCQTPDGPCLEW